MMGDDHIRDRNVPPRASDVAVHLWQVLAAPARRRQVALDPFSMDDGLLGDAFTAAAMFQVTGVRRWADHAQYCIDRLVRIAEETTVNQDGLAGGYAGLLYLLRTLGSAVSVDDDLMWVLEQRAHAFTKVTRGRVLAGVDVRKRRFSYTGSLAGIAHLTAQFPEGTESLSRETLRLICEFLAENGSRDFPGPFWSPRGDLADRDILATPELSFGGRDTGFAHGVSGVISVLLEGALVLGEDRYRRVAAHLLDDLLDDIGRHGGCGMSRYQTPPFDGSPGITATAPGNWAQGLPGLELAVSWDDQLAARLRLTVVYGEEYFLPGRGGFDRPGLADGVAGRLYLADVVGLPSHPRWTGYLAHRLGDYVRDRSGFPGPGFWTGAGGAAAVWFGHRSLGGVGTGTGHARVLSVLGTAVPGGATGLP